MRCIKKSRLAMKGYKGYRQKNLGSRGGSPQFSVRAETVSAKITQEDMGEEGPEKKTAAGGKSRVEDEELKGKESNYEKKGV